MINKLATCIAMVCVKNDLIEPGLQEFLRYKLERLLRTWCFGLFVGLAAAVTQQYLKTICFTTSIYFFRRRMGGWHSSDALICFMLSIGTVMFNVLIVGPLIERLPSKPILFISILLNIIASLLNSNYPVQLHLNEKEIQANIKRKKLLLLLTMTVQLASYLTNHIEIIIYTYLGLQFTVVTVIIENIKTRKDEKHEKLEKSR